MPAVGHRVQGQQAHLAAATEAAGVRVGDAAAVDAPGVGGGGQVRRERVGWAVVSNGKGPAIRRAVL